MRKKIYIVILMMMLSVCSISCTKSVSAPEESTQSTGFIPARAGMYDCADTAVINGINTKEETITFYNIATGRNYTLNYNGTSKLMDRYGTSLSMEQLQSGDIVDITFLKSNKVLNTMQLSLQSWTLDQVSKFEIHEKTREMTVSDSKYSYDEDLFIISNSKEAQIMDINQADVLKLQGIGHKIYSVSVEKGHGYLRLKNDAYFIDGWIEVGQSIIRTIEEDMLLVVPEGSYDVLLSAGSVQGVKRVTITRDQETELDIGDLKGEDIVKYGNLIFAVTPDDAALYIDGEEVDISQPFKTEYGIHQMMAKAEGYQTVTQYIKVGQENATIEVVLEKEGEEKKEETTAPLNPSPSPTASVNSAVSTSGYKVSIDAPAGAEVYIDGNYVGIAPISFTKAVGTHVVTLRKTGYSTRSYTIEVDDTQKDASFSFSELTAIE